MKDPRKQMSLDLITRVRGILADLPDPQIKAIDQTDYAALKKRTTRITLLVDGGELQIYLEEPLPVEVI